MPLKRAQSMTFVVAGGEDSGRRTLTGRFLYDVFATLKYDPADDEPTAPRDTVKFIIQNGQNLDVRLHSSPQQPLSTITDDAGRWNIADVLLLLYGVGNHQTFDEMRALEGVNLGEKFVAGDGLLKAVVATRGDLLQEEWQVSEQEGRELASRLNCDFMVASVMTGEGVSEVFMDYLMREMDKRAEADRLFNPPVPEPDDPGNHISESKAGVRGMWNRVLRRLRKKKE